MIETQVQNFPDYYLSEISSFAVPFDYDYSSIVKDREVLFVLRCKDGIEVVYRDKTISYKSYEYDE